MIEFLKQLLLARVNRPQPTVEEVEVHPQFAGPQGNPPRRPEVEPVIGG